MTNILKYGAYKVGFRENSQTVHDLVSVTLTRRTRSYKKFFKWKYSLDELCDLESKLVLICGSKAKNREEVDHYLNVSLLSVCINSCQSKIIYVLVKLDCVLYRYLNFKPEGNEYT